MKKGPLFLRGTYVQKKVRVKKNGGSKWPFICVLSYLCVICPPVCLAQWLEHKIGSVMGVGSILTCDNNFFSYVVSMLSLRHLYVVCMLSLCRLYVVLMSSLCCLYVVYMSSCSLKRTTRLKLSHHMLAFFWYISPSIVVMIPACHSGGRGWRPCWGGKLLIFFKFNFFWPVI